MNRNKSQHSLGIDTDIELENEVFLPATTRTKSGFLSSTARFFKKRNSNYKLNNESNSNQVKSLLAPDLIQPKKTYAEKVKMRNEIEGPIFVAEGDKFFKITDSDALNIQTTMQKTQRRIKTKAKSYPQESTKKKSTIDILESRRTLAEIVFSESKKVVNPAIKEKYPGQPYYDRPYTTTELINDARIDTKLHMLMCKGYLNILEFSEIIDLDAHIGRDLREHEVYEIKDMIKSKSTSFDKIYYVNNSLNNNFDSEISDSDGHYIFRENDHILYRYITHSTLGKGSYGKVLLCQDNKHNIKCALKIIKSKRQYYNCLNKEIEILTRMRNEFVKYREKGIDASFFTQYLKTFFWRDHGVIVFKLYGKDLYHARLGKLRSDKLRQIMVDLFGALIFLKTSNIIHCDLKPENIMLVNDSTYQIVLGDFGLSKIVKNNKFTDFNVQTCWYRSPEVAMHIPYSYEIDLWSIGVILIELIIDYPLFRAKSDKDLFYLFLKILGDNPNSMIQLNPELRNFTVMGNTRERLERHLSKVTDFIKKNVFSSVEELINGIIVWEPEKRLSLKQCYELAKKIK